MYATVNGYYNGSNVVLESDALLKVGQVVKVLFEFQAKPKLVENTDSFIKSLSLKGHEVPSDISSMETLALEKYL